MKTLERLVAERLLKIKAVKLQPANPFTWASGWKSPIYNDNRKTLSYPEIRSFIKLELARTISEKVMKMPMLLLVLQPEQSPRVH